MPYTKALVLGRISMADCILCSELAVSAEKAPWSAPLVETENFVVVPSLGALVEGWLLIVPKAHHISYGALPFPASPPEQDDRGSCGERPDAPDRQTV